MKTARLTVLLDPDSKLSLEARASALSLTTSELVRRAVDAYEPGADPTSLRLVADELQAAVERVEAKLAAMEAVVARSDEVAEARAAWRAEALQEIRAAGASWPFAAD